MGDSNHLRRRAAWPVTVGILRRLAQEQHSAQQKGPVRVGSVGAGDFRGFGEDCRRFAQKVESSSQHRIIKTLVQLETLSFMKQLLCLCIPPYVRYSYLEEYIFSFEHQRLRIVDLRKKNLHFAFTFKLKNKTRHWKMRITTCLLRQHIGFMFKRHWQIQGKQRIYPTPAEAVLTARGIKVTDVKEYLENWRTKDFVP